MKYFWAFVSCWILELGFSQTLLLDVIDPLGANPLLQKGGSYNAIQGSPFVIDWAEGYLFYGNKKDLYKLRYNAFTDQIHILKDDKEIVLSQGQVERFSILYQAKEYRFIFLTNLPVISYSYAQIIYEGNVKVYYRHHRKLREQSATEMYSADLKSEALEPDDSFIIVMPNGKTFLTKGRRKEVLNIFANKRSEIEEFIKKEKINTEKLNGLMQVVLKYEELIK